jgi:hypothetical protein
MQRQLSSCNRWPVRHSIQIPPDERECFTALAIWTSFRVPTLKIVPSFFLHPSSIASNPVPLVPLPSSVSFATLDKWGPVNCLSESCCGLLYSPLWFSIFGFFSISCSVCALVFRRGGNAAARLRQRLHRKIGGIRHYEAVRVRHRQGDQSDMDWRGWFPSHYAQRRH